MISVSDATTILGNDGVVDLDEYARAEAYGFAMARVERDLDSAEFVRQDDGVWHGFFGDHVSRGDTFVQAVASMVTTLSVYYGLA